MAFRLRRWLERQAFLIAAGRWLTGYRSDGRPGRTRRAAWRSGCSAAVAGLVAAWLAAPAVMTWVFAVLMLVSSLAGVGLAVRWALAFRHRRTWLRPLHLAAHQLAGIDRRRSPHQWIQVAPDRSRAVLALPAGWPPDGSDKQRLVAIASAKLGLEAPEASWRLAGPKPQLELTTSQPPPARVSLADVRERLDKTKPDELLWGLGKRGVAVTSSLSGDSPHIGLSMGSGAGKSVTARALAAQMLYKGCIVLILDYKMISHQWAAGLPNVAIARRPHEIHRALLWLGGEVDRRNEVALAGADMDGNVHAVVGPRLIVVCEELNATVAKLRAHWRGERNGDRDLPQRSPALEALDAASFMGRQVLVNIVYIGQRLSVKASGGDGDARENIGVLAFGRYSPSNWRMLAADHAMPPSSRTPGRIQVVSDSVRETQAVFMSAREARALATAGEVALLPAGMPGAPRVAASQSVRELVPRGPEQPFVVEDSPKVLAPSGLVTLREAVNEGVVASTLHALRKASQRDSGFPERKNLRGLAAEYDPVELAEWEATRR